MSYSRKIEADYYVFLDHKQNATNHWTPSWGSSIAVTISSASSSAHQLANQIRIWLVFSCRISFYIQISLTSYICCELILYLNLFQRLCVYQYIVCVLGFTTRGKAILD